MQRLLIGPGRQVPMVPRHHPGGDDRPPPAPVTGVRDPRTQALGSRQRLGGASTKGVLRCVSTSHGDDDGVRGRGRECGARWRHGSEAAQSRRADPARGPYLPRHRGGRRARHGRNRRRAAGHDDVSDCGVNNRFKGSGGVVKHGQRYVEVTMVGSAKVGAPARPWGRARVAARQGAASAGRRGVPFVPRHAQPFRPVGARGAGAGLLRPGPGRSAACPPSTASPTRGCFAA